MSTRLLITFLLTIYFGTSTGQIINNTHRFDTSNIYNNAISKYLDEYKKIKKYSLDVMFIEENREITDSILLLIDDTKIKVLKHDKLSDTLKKVKGLLVHKISNLNYVNNEFFVFVTPYSCTYNNKKDYNSWTYSGSFKFVYKYENDNFLYLRIEDLGF